MNDCGGCTVELDKGASGAVYGATIVYCPLHAAAEEMYNRLESLAHYMHILANGALNSPAKQAGVGKYKQELRAMRDVIESTLSYARGQEPAEDSEMPLGDPRRGLG